MSEPTDRIDHFEEKKALREEIERLKAERSTIRAVAIDDFSVEVQNKICCGAGEMVRVCEIAARLKEE